MEECHETHLMKFEIVSMLNMEDGMDPFKELLNTIKISSASRVPISCGNSPVVYIAINDVVTFINSTPSVETKITHFPF